MAEEKKKHHKKPRKIVITRHDDGSYSHEHMHDDGKHNMFAGTSSSLDDVHQHIDDHLGGGGEPAEEAAEAGAPGGDPNEGAEPGE